MQSARNLLAIRSRELKIVLETSNDSQAIQEQELEEFDFEKEFDIVLNSAQNNDHLEVMHYVNRTRRMRCNDPNNFYTLAAETVVACFSNGRRKIDKYAAIYLHLKKARLALNKNLDKQIEALEKIQQLSDSVIDIFNYSL